MTSIQLIVAIAVVVAPRAADAPTPTTNTGQSDAQDRTQHARHAQGCGAARLAGRLAIL